MLNITIPETATIMDAFKQLNATSEKVLLIVDSNNYLLGTLSDGDIRRSLLAGHQLDLVIKDIYNQKPKFLYQENYSQEKAKSLLIEYKIELLPIVNKNGILIDYITWEQLFSEKKPWEIPPEKLSLPVVIMAGGKGKRLEPFTKVLPKPLIPIGEKTILEHIISEFEIYGINDFWITLNYRGEMIQTYLNAIKLDHNLSFIHEEDFYGTAGSLSLIDSIQSETFFVTNCDIIVKAKWDEVVRFHQESNASITVVSCIQHHVIPYGVIEFTNGGRVTAINEKPEFAFPINTGVYLVEKNILGLIPKKKVYHMTDLIQAVIAEGKSVCTHMVNERDYIDIGQWDEYQKVVAMLSIV